MSVKPELYTRSAPGGGEASFNDLAELRKSVDELVGRYRTKTEELQNQVKDLQKSEGEKRNEEQKWKEEVANKFKELNATVEELGKVASRAKAATAGSDFNGSSSHEKDVQFRAMSLLMQHGFKRELILKDEKVGELEKRALSSLVGEKGGYTVPKIVEDTILQKVYEISGTRKVVPGLPCNGQIVNVLRGGGVSVIVGDETDPFADQSHEFESTDVRIWDLKASIYVPNNLLEDTSANLIQYISENVSLAIAEKEDQLFAKGTGSKQPRGIFVHPDLTNAVYNKSTNPAGFAKTGVAAGLSDASNNGLDALKRLISYVKAGYRTGAIWQMNSATMAEVAILKDENGQYLWHTDASGVFPGILLGYGVNINEFIDDIGAGKFPIGYGNLRRAYRIYDRSGLISWEDQSVRRIQDQTAYGFKKRLGGDTVDPLAFKLLKCSA